MLELYRQLSSIRRRYAVDQALDAEVLDLPRGVVGIKRGTLIAALNLTDSAVDLGQTAGELRLVFSTSGSVDAGTTLPACSTSWYEII